MEVQSNMFALLEGDGDAENLLSTFAVKVDEPPDKRKANGRTAPSGPAASNSVNPQRLVDDARSHTHKRWQNGNGRNNFNKYNGPENVSRQNNNRGSGFGRNNGYRPNDRPNERPNERPTYPYEGQRNRPNEVQGNGYRPNERPTNRPNHRPTGQGNGFGPERRPKRQGNELQKKEEVSKVEVIDGVEWHVIPTRNQLQRRFASSEGGERIRGRERNGERERIIGRGRNGGRFGSVNGDVGGGERSRGRERTVDGNVGGGERKGDGNLGGGERNKEKEIDGDGNVGGGAADDNVGGGERNGNGTGNMGGGERKGSIGGGERNGGRERSGDKIISSNNWKRHQEMTLKDYEKKLEEKRKVLESMKTQEERVVTLDEEFELMHIIQKKNNFENDKASMDRNGNKKKSDNGKLKKDANGDNAPKPVVTDPKRGGRCNGRVENGNGKDTSRKADSTGKFSGGKKAEETPASLEEQFPALPIKVMINDVPIFIRT